MALGTRDELRRALLRLVGTEATDPELVLRGEEQGVVLDDHLQDGIWKAQRYLVDIGAGSDWLTSAALAFGAADAAGERVAELPADFLRLAGDESNPALYAPDGRPWGELLRDKRLRRRARGDWYFLAGRQIRTTNGAQPPADVRVDYYGKVALPGTSELDFPEEARPLIVAEAAMGAVHEYWVPAPNGRVALESALARNLGARKAEAAAVLRRETGRQGIGEMSTTGSHWFA